MKGKVGQTEVVPICIYGRMGRAKAEVYLASENRAGSGWGGRGRAEAEVGVEPKAKRPG